MTKKEKIELLKKVEKMLYGRRWRRNQFLKKRPWVHDPWVAGLYEAETLVYNLRRKMEE